MSNTTFVPSTTAADHSPFLSAPAELAKHLHAMSALAGHGPQEAAELAGALGCAAQPAG
jgi:hypothetical protein